MTSEKKKQELLAKKNANSEEKNMTECIQKLYSKKTPEDNSRNKCYDVNKEE